jgi:NDP-sugar pyrophosphorylase family protein
VQVVNSRAFASIQPGAAAQSIGDVYDRLIAERPGSIVGFVSDWSFLDIGSVSDYMRASSQLRLASPGSTTAGGDNTRIDPTARVTTDCLNEVSIGREASVERCVVTDHVSIPAGGTFKDQILVARGGAIASFPIGHEA